MFACRWNSAKRSDSEDVQLVKLGADERYYVYFKATETFGSLRDRIAADKGVAPQRISLSSDWAHPTEYTVSKYNNALVSSVYTKIKATLHPAPTVDLRAHVATLEVPVRRTAEEKEFVRQILSGEPRYFTQLFDLLAMNAPAVVRAHLFVFVLYGVSLIFNSLAHFCVLLFDLAGGRRVVTAHGSPH